MMKLEKRSAKLLALLAISVGLIPAIFAQTKPAAKPSQKATKTTAKAATPAAAPKPSTGTAAAPSPEVASAGTPAEAEKPQSAGPRRDPFLPLVNDRKEAGNMEHLPPGKAGLVIATVRVDGTVRSQDGMIAVLSNSDQHVYFAREGDELYDGDVEKIGLDGVTFRQNSKDAFGKRVERVVTKRIYASAGEQQ
jgi:hypothetical protein